LTSIRKFCDSSKGGSVKRAELGFPRRTLSEYEFCSLRSVEYGKHKEKNRSSGEKEEMDPSEGKETDSASSNLLILATDSYSLRGVEYGGKKENCSGAEKWRIAPPRGRG